jgi:exodeoxyribonuclease VII large subunit
MLFEMEENRVLSVTDVNKHIKNLMGADQILSALWVKGEISNYKLHSSGHMYFTLKDVGALLKCVMFKGNASRLQFIPENGLKVVLRGYVSVYERDGQYQLYAEHMEQDGLGNLHLAFEKLKSELLEKGYFDPSRKKKIPFLPKRICVLTSPTGSVIRDIIHVITRRFPQVNLCVFPVGVQGESASKQIKHAIEVVNQKQLADVIILARGGGSLEELWPFNEIEVAEGIYHSKIPIISAVGHETDFTISDFVADLRAPTPSAAAELVLPEKALLESSISNLKGKLYHALLNLTKVKRSLLQSLIQRPVLKQPYHRIHGHRQQIDNLTKLLITYQNTVTQKKALELANKSGRLNALSPLNVLSRGYSVVTSKVTKNLIHSVEDVVKNDRIEVEFKNGKLDCVVEDVRK